MPQTTATAILHASRSDRHRIASAVAQALYIYDETDVTANGMDDGYSTTAIYEFRDGSRLRVNGAGIHAEPVTA